MNNDHCNTENWIAIEQAAETLGNTPLNVLMHIKRDLLVGVEQEGGWRVEPASLAALLQKRREGETPAVCKSGCAKKTGGCGSCS